MLADRPRRPATFLVLGSASPHLLKQSSETLAGRITYHELDGFGLADVGPRHWRRLWLRGGYPRSYLARTDAESFSWRQDLRRTCVEQDLPALGPGYPARTIERVWEMLAHYHGQVWNGSEIARSFGVSHTTSRRYLDLLVDTFMVRLLAPWTGNQGKRLVKSPKLYFRDVGLLHQLLGIRRVVVGGGVDAVQSRQYDVAPDGRFLINTELDSAAVPITVLMNWSPEAKR